MILDEDDTPIGRIVSRRDAVRLLAASGAAVIVGCKPGGSPTTDSAAAPLVASAGEGTLPQCVAKPELTIGPYFVDNKLNRSDIRTNPTTNAAKPGTPLRLEFSVQQIANGQCSPLSGAMVDIWHCDAAGLYSGVNDNMVGFNTVGEMFLRGYQISDANGVARFTTIYPGWYQGRAVHIHFRIRTPASAVAAMQSDKVYDFTSQIFFDESVTDRVHAQAPYAAKGQRDRRNQNDGIYRQAGDTLLVKVASAADGYDARFDIGLDLSDANTGRADDMRRGGRR